MSSKCFFIHTSEFDYIDESNKEIVLNSGEKIKYNSGDLIFTENLYNIWEQANAKKMDSVSD